MDNFTNKQPSESTKTTSQPNNSEKISQRRFPRILADQVSRALHNVRDLDPDYALEMLFNWRRARANYIANVGVTSLVDQPSDNVIKSAPIPYQHLNKIVALDEAFEALHNYLKGGFSEYASKGVNSALSRERSSKPRDASKKVSYEEVARYIFRRGYHSSDSKKCIMLDALERFDISESTFYRAVKDFKPDF
ncbi:hypothetical protein [Sedimenticola thiotaurini]|uniref:hypothetical protein n=1 Tax=Sedimenticola thiotaurini TaxID=1543721 RepID=UPI0019003D51|nr:hypothetical protein [Sedimenticola thiotaurini]